MPVQTVSPTEVFKQQSQEMPVPILDVRTPGEFVAMHAAGARSAPLDQLDPAALVGGPGERAYLICESGSRAALAYEKFRAAGYNNVSCIEGGTAAWAKAGLPVIRGQGGVISLERQVRIAAGSLVLIGVLLGWFVHPAFFALSAFVGAGLIFSGITNFCGMGILLTKMPWNRTPACHSTAKCC